MGRKPPRQLISVLVPFGGKDPHRLRVWRWLRTYYTSHLHGYEIVMGTDRRSKRTMLRRKPMAFSKAVAVNNAFRKSHGDIIVVLDADTYIDADVIMHWAERLRAQMRRGVHSWAIPYRYLLRLNAHTTEELLETDPHGPFHFPQPPPEDDIEGYDGSGWGHIYGALIQIMPRQAFITVGGFDVRFRGWGGEDQAFLFALDALWGKYQNSPNTVYHLHHPKIIAAQGTDAEGKRSEIRAWEGQDHIRANDWLSGMYWGAKGRPDKMRLLVDSAKRYVDKPRRRGRI